MIKFTRTKAKILGKSSQMSITAHFLSDYLEGLWAVALGSVMVAVL